MPAAPIVPFVPVESRPHPPKSQKFPPASTHPLAPQREPGSTPVSNGALNDLWVYTPSVTAGQAVTWAWVKGSNTGSQNGIYGNEVIPYLTYEIWTPGGRSNGTHWVDLQNQLWLFGGAGYDSTSTTGNGYLNDMWRYLPYR